MRIPVCVALLSLGISSTVHAWSRLPPSLATQQHIARGIYTPLHAKPPRKTPLPSSYTPLDLPLSALRLTKDAIYALADLVQGARWEVDTPKRNRGIQEVAETIASTPKKMRSIQQDVSGTIVRATQQASELQQIPSRVASQTTQIASTTANVLVAPVKLLFGTAITIRNLYFAAADAAAAVSAATSKSEEVSAEELRRRMMQTEARIAAARQREEVINKVIQAKDAAFETADTVKSIVVSTVDIAAGIPSLAKTTADNVVSFPGAVKAKVVAIQENVTRTSNSVRKSVTETVDLITSIPQKTTQRVVKTRDQVLVVVDKILAVPEATSKRFNKVRQEVLNASNKVGASFAAVGSGIGSFSKATASALQKLTPPPPPPSKAKPSNQRTTSQPPQTEIPPIHSEKVRPTEPSGVVAANTADTVVTVTPDEPTPLPSITQAAQAPTSPIETNVAISVADVSQALEKANSSAVNTDVSAPAGAVVAEAVGPSAFDSNTTRASSSAP